MLVAYVVATCFVCPQGIVDDTQLKVCASNAYGLSNVTESQIANWNCNHPNNRKILI